MVSTHFSACSAEANDLSSGAAAKARNITNTVTQKIEAATFALGGGLKSWAHDVAQKGPHQGVLGHTAASLAHKLEGGGDYLQREGFKGIADNATNLIRRNPIPALLVGLGAGCLLGRLIARR